MPLEVFGEWTTHEKFGRQLNLSGWRPWAADKVGLRIFLRDGLGIVNENAVDKIILTHGSKAFEFFSDEAKMKAFFDENGWPELLDQVVEAWGLAKTSSELSEFFSDKDVTSAHIQGVYQSFGVEAKDVILANPYELVKVPIFDFSKVDEIADRMGLKQEDPRRFEGAVFWVLREASSNGHLCVRRGDFVSHLGSLSRQGDVAGFGDKLAEQLSAAIARMVEKKAVYLDTRVGVYLPQHYRFERDSARLLADFITPMKLDVDLPEFISSYETVNSITLSEAQRDAVTKLVNNKVLALTGLPGTGKTTIVRALVHLLKRIGYTFTLMAPTGIAAKRLAYLTGDDAYTIHRAFGFDGTDWMYNQENKYPVQAVIVDEMSMVDQELFYRIVSSLNPGTFLVFVGDDAQLPSVGPGNVLRELVHCDLVPTVRLTQIFRQSETSDIVLNSHRINRGEPIQTKGSESEFQFVPILDEEKIRDLVVKMAVKLKSKDANFQILAPKYDGTVGVNALNEALREALNPPEPGKTEFSAGTLKVRIGDRVMVIKNDYKLGIYNGDMGKVVGLTSDALVVRIHGAGEGGIDMNVDIPRKEAMSKLRLAYAITVHKSQGSEFDTVILPMVKSHGRMLQRNLFYTGVTRAKKRVWLLGESGAIAKAIANDDVIQRNTGLSYAITDFLTKASGGVEESP